MWSKPGRIRHQGVEPFVALGELDNSRSERVERLAEAFADAGVNTKVSPDIQSSSVAKTVVHRAGEWVGRSDHGSLLVSFAPALNPIPYSARPWKRSKLWLRRAGFRSPKTRSTKP